MKWPNRSHPLVLMIDALYPRPDEDSGSLDQLNFARAFRSLDYEVAFASLFEFSAGADTMRPLSEVGVKCVAASDYLNIEEFVFLHATQISAFFLSRFGSGGAWIEKARSFCPHAQVILNTVDLHHVREGRKARLTNDDAALRRAQATKEAELSRIAAADVTVVVSQTECKLLEELMPAADVRVIPLFRDIRERSFPPFEARDGIAFIGAFQHQPNIDAITTFLDTMWPEILAASPTMNFRVIGSHMPDWLSRRQDRNVEWVGHVPDLQPWLDKVRMTVAPLRYGAGAKGKVVSSLLNAVPCVASQVAAEGMGIPDGDGILIAQDANDFVRLVLALHDDEALWTQSSKLGFSTVQQAYSIERGLQLIEQILPRVNPARRSLAASLILTLGRLANRRGLSVDGGGKRARSRSRL